MKYKVKTQVTVEAPSAEAVKTVEIGNCRIVAVSYGEFKQLFPKGSFDCFSVPAMRGESEDFADDVMAVSYVVPVQDEPDPPVFQVTMMLDATEDEYADLMWAARLDEEVCKGETYPTIDQAIRAAKSAAFACASGKAFVE